MVLVRILPVFAIVVSCFAPGSSFSGPLSDGSIYSQDFEAIELGELPEGWESHVQTTNGRVHGHVEVSDFFETKSFRISDGHAHVAAWSVSDEIFPEDGNWAVQFDMRLASPFNYSRRVMGDEDTGAVFGLKKGGRRRGDFLPLIRLDGVLEDGEEIFLFGMDEVLEENLAVDRWHRIVIRRDGTTWRFYLDNDLKATITEKDTGLRGYAFGSFKNWQHTARDVYIDNFKIGRFIE